MTALRRAAGITARRALTTGIAVLAGVMLLAGCTSGETSYPKKATPTDSPALTAIRAAIGEINHVAGGPVDAQRSVLDRLAAPGESATQRACPAATTTLAFDPAYAGLQSRDDSEYLLPTYITIYTGGHITGSDLATLRLWVINGAARTSALCVS